MNPINSQENIHWVYQSIINWHQLTDQKDELKKVLQSNNNTFYFLKGIIENDNIHAYLGYLNHHIYLHFIPTSFDKEQSFADFSKIPDQMQSCIATNDEVNLGGPIDQDEAIKRIENWKDEEIRNQVLDSIQIHQAFFIPNDNFSLNAPLKVVFALNQQEPDLILTTINEHESYYDTCRPVPPFPPGVEESEFSLLQIIKLNNFI